MSLRNRIAEHAGVKQSRNLLLLVAVCYLTVPLYRFLAKPPVAAESDAPLPRQRPPSTIRSLARSPGPTAKSRRSRTQRNRPARSADAGPPEPGPFRLLDDGPGELVWITAAHVRVVDANTNSGYRTSSCAVPTSRSTKSGTARFSALSKTVRAWC